MAQLIGCATCLTDGHPTPMATSKRRHATEYTIEGGPKYLIAFSTCEVCDFMWRFSSSWKARMERTAIRSHALRVALEGGG